MGKIEVYRAIVEQARTEYEQCPMTGAVPMKWCSLYLRVNEYGHVVPTKREYRFARKSISGHTGRAAIFSNRIKWRESSIWW